MNGSNVASNGLNGAQPALGINPKDRLGLNKVRLSLVPPSSIIYQALAMEDGAVKYGPYNWRENKVVVSIYIDAAMRHLQSYFDGEECAQDSKKPHLGHALACIGIIVDALETGNLVDDRPKPGAAARLIAELEAKKRLAEADKAVQAANYQKSLTDAIKDEAAREKARIDTDLPKQKVGT
jgi:hypothetical protein